MSSVKSVKSVKLEIKPKLMAGEPAESTGPLLPIWALVGRPNVGKSTLFNQLTRSRDALVANFAGLTRDRQYGTGRIGDRAYQVIDTGGIAKGDILPLGVQPSQDPDRALIKSLQLSVEQQATQAMNEAAVVMVVMDAREGVGAADQELLSLARKSGKPIILVVNKVEGLNEASVAAEFHSLGVSRTVFTAAAHGRGIAGLVQEAFEVFDASIASLVATDQAALEAAGSLDLAQMASAASGIRFAIVGRPNVGKSTLTNRMLGGERVVVSDMPGTTRDSVFIPFSRHGQDYTLIDTAGVRRRGKVSETVEKFSVLKTFAAIEAADVALLMIDAREPFVDQDLHLLTAVAEAQKPMIIVVNKWDGLADSEKDFVKKQIDRRLSFLDGVAIQFVSALHGTGVGLLYAKIMNCYKGFSARPATGQLNHILGSLVADHPPPMVRGRRIKLKYVHLGGSRPPRLIIYGSQSDKVPDAYRRYLAKGFRKALDLSGIPLPLEFKSPDNPYAGRKNKLTPRQQQRRKRMMRHVKKKR
jgi:GTP-binding protein